MSLGDVGMQEDIQREMQRRETLAVTTNDTFPYLVIGTRPYGLTKAWLEQLLHSTRSVSELVIRALVPKVKFAQSINDVWCDPSKLPNPTKQLSGQIENSEPIAIDPNLVADHYIRAKTIRVSQHSILLELRHNGAEVFLDGNKHWSKVVHYWYDNVDIENVSPEQTPLKDLLDSHRIIGAYINPRSATIHGFIVEDLENNILETN